MAAFAIMRCKKLAKMGNVAASFKHAYRERETLNADASRTPDNNHWAAKSTDEAMGRLRELLPEKRRKDAVLAVEYVLTASPDWWKSASQEQQAAFFDQAHKWLANKYGADRIVTASIHRDETSPHMTAFVVPLTQDGRLSAKEFIGNRNQMTRDQTTFAASVADLGLARGMMGSRATHQRVQSFYGALGAEQEDVAITLEALKPRTFSDGHGVFGRALGMIGIHTEKETPLGVAERLTEDIKAAYAPTIQKALESRQNAKRLREVQQGTADLQKRLQPVLEALDGFSQEQQTKLIAGLRYDSRKMRDEAAQIEAQRAAELVRKKAVAAQQRQLRTLSGKPVRGRRDMGR